MPFSTAECAWHNTRVKVFNRTLVGLRGFEFGKTKETEYLYAAGDEPIDIQTGNKGYPVTLKILKYELDDMNDAARAAGYEDITEVPHEAVVITCLYKKKASDPIRTVTSTGVKFSDIKAGMDQGAKFDEVSLPALSMKTVFL